MERGKEVNRLHIRKIQPPAPPLPRQKRVAAYARVSDGKEAMFHSLAAQVSYYSDLIGKNPNWEYRGVYSDEALSGTRENRPGFQALLSECRAGNIDLVITNAVITKGQFYKGLKRPYIQPFRANLTKANRE